MHDHLQKHIFGVDWAIKFGKYKKGKLIELGQNKGIEDEIKELLSDGRHEIKERIIGQVMEIGARNK